MKKFEELRKIYFDLTFQDENNTDIIRKIRQIFKKDTDDLMRTSILVDADTKKLEITIFLKNQETNQPDIITIYKDRNSKEIYLKNKEHREFVSKHYEKIMNIYCTLEEFVDIANGPLSSINSMMNSQVFSDSFLDVALSFNHCGIVKISMKINKQEDPNNIYNREWYNRKKLSQYVKENEEEILRKIPVKIDRLDDAIRKIVEAKLNIKGKTFTKNKTLH